MGWNSLSIPNFGLLWGFTKNDRLITTPYGICIYIYIYIMNLAEIVLFCSLPFIMQSHCLLRGVAPRPQQQRGRKDRWMAEVCVSNRAGSPNRHFSRWHRAVLQKTSSTKFMCITMVAFTVVWRPGYTNMKRAFKIDAYPYCLLDFSLQFALYK